MDWKEMLGQLRADPSLPPGEETAPEPEGPAEKRPGTLRVIVDKKGRKGKVATIVEGFEEDDDRVAEVAARLKKRLGVGGSSRGGEILIQGACADRVCELLREMNYKVKKG